jgi:hypothetical protein
VLACSAKSPYEPEGREFESPRAHHSLVANLNPREAEQTVLYPFHEKRIQAELGRGRYALTNSATVIAM